MYTYEDLLNKVAVRCNSTEETELLKAYFQNHGHNVPESVFRNYYNGWDIFDIWPQDRVKGRISMATESWYKINGYKVIDFNELEDIQEINIEDFESILMD